ncbi:Asp-tRNA(Asn)/Glu-tRNA(Gln) amidotransferase subunit GatC [Candidatus Thioglobus sp. NP1]|jgi:aspartyl-tRNA(Asn)/glutamyl-tRNA(Gln) amidotransferase subunit C|uniref:Asp-tRNA(Asn)/Glu-tRNA(Gln) amidotransferase subunit GatC n=1 Tax=Candidatus Thioglobus sp. NP1 TaxID=2508687 RepID=UPI000DED63ED|nr:Asp-tRNA(Asn)/Glu-tRNA(Gln) amidotransferase subunit GatC [Candidatus Thioglobus sp. NP1]AXE61847.1 Asp-tRNA(Asn)/Glu-tRNA(Gln) amidotransferase GatCAB subunit C [Candidatus Thioglobus sp. NP1]|tara:strand:- start:185 stop:472 length:288 start_codon:yes stop_codon:yes gene_type:complete
MSLDQKQVKEIAYLARLNVSDSELVKSTEELNNILNLMEELGDIDTGEIEPMAHPLHMSQRLRTDEVTETDLSKEFQEIAPKKGKDHFLVPTVIE